MMVDSVAELVDASGIRDCRFESCRSSLMF